jgi:hypothetical protein
VKQEVNNKEQIWERICSQARNEFGTTTDFLWNVSEQIGHTLVMAQKNEIILLRCQLRNICHGNKLGAHVSVGMHNSLTYLGLDLIITLICRLVNLFESNRFI